MQYLVVPGLGGSGLEHWQGRWTAKNANHRMVQQRDWNRPDPAAWVASLETYVSAFPPPSILVAHSLGCALVAHWAINGSTERVAAAMLVAPADVDSDAHTPAECRPFAPIPLEPLPFPAVLVYSRDDPFISADRARYFAQAWGATPFEAGALGHINEESDLGDWPDGEKILATFLKAVASAVS